MTALDNEIAALVGEVTGDTGIGPQTRLDGDLVMDSIELAALSQRVQEKYGADLFSFVSGLEIDQIIELTVADVAAYINGQR